MTTKLRYTDHASLAIKLTPTVQRDEYLDYMTFQANERPLFTEVFGPLIGLKEEWEDQGATPEELDLSAFEFRAPMKAHVPVKTGWLGGPPEEILKDTPTERIYRDRRGRRMKLCKGMATLPLPMDYPVADMDDWLKVKHHYEFSEERFPEGWAEQARAQREAGCAIVVTMQGGFDEPRQLLGEEEICISYYTQPELIHDILDTIGETTHKVLERVSAAVQVDELALHEDMAGKSGPLAGPQQVTEFIKPYYRRIWDMLRDRGARLFGQDSDGDMNPVVDAFLDAGLNFMFPNEPAANMDIVQLRQKYGTRLAFMGGIDKHVLRRSKAEIEAELEYKVPPIVRTGGCIFGLDHRIPNGTPLEHYRFYVEKMWEIMNREAAKL